MGPVTVKRSDVFCDAEAEKDQGKHSESTCSESVTWHWGCSNVQVLPPLTLLSSTVISINGASPFYLLKCYSYVWCAHVVVRKLWDYSKQDLGRSIKASISHVEVLEEFPGLFELVRSLLWQALLSPNVSEWYCIFSWVVGYSTANEF